MSSTSEQGGQVKEFLKAWAERPTEARLLVHAIQSEFLQYPAIVLSGPAATGKSTLCFDAMKMRQAEHIHLDFRHILPSGKCDENEITASICGAIEDQLDALTYARQSKGEEEGEGEEVPEGRFRRHSKNFGELSQSLERFVLWPQLCGKLYIILQAADALLSRHVSVLETLLAAMSRRVCLVLITRSSLFDSISVLGECLHIPFLHYSRANLEAILMKTVEEWCKINPRLPRVLQNEEQNQSGVPLLDSQGAVDGEFEGEVIVWDAQTQRVLRSFVGFLVLSIYDLSKNLQIARHVLVALLPQVAHLVHTMRGPDRVKATSTPPASHATSSPFPKGKTNDPSTISSSSPRTPSTAGTLGHSHFLWLNPLIKRAFKQVHDNSLVEGGDSTQPTSTSLGSASPRTTLFSSASPIRPPPRTPPPELSASQPPSQLLQESGKPLSSSNATAYGTLDTKIKFMLVASYLASTVGPSGDSLFITNSHRSGKRKKRKATQAPTSDRPQWTPTERVHAIYNVLIPRGDPLPEPQITRELIDLSILQHRIRRGQEEVRCMLSLDAAEGLAKSIGVPLHRFLQG